jgi:GntR family transcriptional regulator / MocR family aminotransferase
MSQIVAPKWTCTRSNIDKLQGSNDDRFVELHVTFAGRRDLTGQIYRQLRAAVVDGRLPPGTSLPPSRELARRLAVSRNTVTSAYVRLIGEGFLLGRVGAGTFVAPSAGGGRLARSAPAGAPLRPRAVWDAIPDPSGPRRHAAFDFRLGTPDARLFPYAAWRRIFARELRVGRLPSTGTSEPAGELRLRQAIARHLGVARSVQAGADDVLVTSGAQQALDLVGRVLVEPGTPVALEEPGYPLVRRLFQSLGARIAPVPVDSEGLIVDALPRGARLVYVTPSHQFPLGMPMSLPRRQQLLAWAERRQAVIVEDDYDSEFRFGGRPLEPLQCLDRSGRVVYVGSFSKVLLPALRLGYLVAPLSLRPALHKAKMVADLCGSSVIQAALARLIDDGLLARHVRSARREYAARRDRLEAALARELGDRLELVPAVAGLHIAAHFRGGGLDDREVARRAEEAGVIVQALSEYAAVTPARPGLAFGYGAIAGARIDEGIRRLAACLPRRRARVPYVRLGPR